MFDKMKVIDFENKKQAVAALDNNCRIKSKTDLNGYFFLFQKLGSLYVAYLCSSCNNDIVYHEKIKKVIYSRITDIDFNLKY